MGAAVDHGPHQLTFLDLAVDDIAQALGLLFQGDGMEFSALPWTPHQLEYAAHPHELPAVHHTVVRVSAMQMGLGGDNSWGAKPRPEYLLPEEAMAFRFRFRAIGG